MALGRISTPEEREKIISLYYSDMTAQEIATSVNRSYPFVIKVWKEAGLLKQMTRQQRSVMKLRKQGKCSVEIAAELGIRYSTVNATANAIGMPFTEAEKQKSIKLGKAKAICTQYGNEFERRQKQIDFITKYYPQFEYVSGYIASDDFMELRCKRCGLVFKRASVTLRHTERLTCCPVCEEKHKQEELARIEAEKEAERQEEKRRKTEAFWSQKFEQVSLRMSQCRECGTFYIGGRGCYCSDECKRKYINRKHDRRLDRAKRIDKSISLKKLYKRDKGICWICGKKCDYKDYTKDENGYFVVGANYPSIDHVYPLSKGGNHEWNNVKLAHHYCNTLKNDKVVAYG